ncbi:unnamed protein product [Calicophoron daubneyi]|uniref:Uncharacterized protein n=1 Tax=Calicophoron daubneyi TaxID=300641 RepID=A0AAV2TMH8_CALDB
MKQLITASWPVDCQTHLKPPTHTLEKGTLAYTTKQSCVRQSRKSSNTMSFWIQGALIPLVTVAATTSSAMVLSSEVSSDTLFQELVFYVKGSAGDFASPKLIAAKYSQLPIQELALRLGSSVIWRPEVYDESAHQEVNDYMWIVGLVIGPVVALVLLIWLVLSTYYYVVRAEALGKWMKGKRKIGKPGERLEKSKKSEKPTEYLDEAVQFGSPEVHKTIPVTKKPRESTHSSVLINAAPIDGLTAEQVRIFTTAQVPRHRVRGENDNRKSTQSLDHSQVNIDEKVIEATENKREHVRSTDNAGGRSRTNSKNNSPTPLVVTKHAPGMQDAKIKEGPDTKDDEPELLRSAGNWMTPEGSEWYHVKPIVISDSPRPGAIAMADRAYSALEGWMSENERKRRQQETNEG